MNEQKELALEGFWIRPRSYVSYLDDDLFVFVEFRNNSDAIIEIKSITCSFQVEPSLPKHASQIFPHISMRPNNRSSILKIPFTVELTLQFATNYPDLDVEYTIDKNTKTVSFCNPDTRCIIINPKHPPEKHFFLSHKDPENTGLAERLDRHLQKIGFIGYVAENDPKPGLDIWDEKIFPSIDDSTGLIVLWTKDAANSPDTIYKEIEYANKKEKRIILLAEKDVEIPTMLQGTIEYMTIDETIADYDLVRLVDTIHNLYKLGSF